MDEVVTHYEGKVYATLFAVHPRVKAIVFCVRCANSSAFRNSLPLSVSSPSTGNGSNCRARSSAWTTLFRAVQQRLAFRPAGGDVRQGERVEERALRAAAGVCDEVGLQEARPRVGPLREGPHGNLMLEQGPRTLQPPR